ncbi:hypothetical protein LTR37_016586 [Vermiconidia calcicola]|uniref:Uncharacterized protein n=1 Tax=Vermiconidia calcicola TaxID=1690605 RepID=A0ACC3MNX0_9PEZI|nr:hypothetical protein LTR37_016586 [Vermiconidia calcicola]
MTGQFGWQSLPGWKILDLSQLRDLKFDPMVQSLGENLDEMGGEDAITEGANEALASVFEKSKDSLEQFEYRSECPMQWPGDQVVALPKLKNLKLGSFGNGSIRHRNFRAWMAEMPSLENLELNGSRLCKGVPLTCWLDVFDAIRDHSKGMRIRMNQSVANSAAEVSMDYHTDDFEEVLAEPVSEELWANIERSLSLYFSGKIGCDDTFDKLIPFSGRACEQRIVFKDVSLGVAEDDVKFLKCPEALERLGHRPNWPLHPAEKRSVDIGLDSKLLQTGKCSEQGPIFRYTFTHDEIYAYTRDRTQLVEAQSANEAVEIALSAEKKAIALKRDIASLTVDLSARL